MLQLFLALLAAGFVSGAPPTVLKGCPNGGLGVGLTWICPGGNCQGHSPTSTIFAPGTCKPIAHGTPVNNAGLCTIQPDYNDGVTDPYTEGVFVGCVGGDVYVDVPRLGNFTNCVYLGDDAGSIDCGNSTLPYGGRNYIYECCT